MHSGRIPAARAAAVALAIGTARSQILRGDYDTAVAELLESMTGDLANSPELYGALGWVYSRQSHKYVGEASSAFERAAELGNTKEDTYYHWASMEERLADEASRYPGSETHLTLGRYAFTRRSSASRCAVRLKPSAFVVGYGRGREAKLLERQNRFAEATGAFADSVAWMRRALKAPASSVGDISRSDVYRGIALAQDGMGDSDGLKATLSEWEQVVPEHDAARWDVDRLSCKAGVSMGKNDEATAEGGVELRNR